ATTPHEMLRTEVSFSLAANLLGWLQAPDSMDLAAITQTREEVTAIIDAMAQEAKEGKTKFTGEEAEQLVKLLQEQLENVRIGSPAPEITGVDIQGKTFKLSDYQGKVVLL